MDELGVGDFQQNPPRPEKEDVFFFFLIKRYILTPSFGVNLSLSRSLTLASSFFSLLLARALSPRFNMIYLLTKLRVEAG